MGTETVCLKVWVLTGFGKVKLNNPLMGTETGNRPIYGTLHLSLCVKLNNPTIRA